MVADAVILAGGLGTRIRPVTGGRIPKILVPVLGRPFIDYKLRSMSLMGVKRVVLLLGSGGDMVESYVGAGKEFDLEVEYRHDGDVLLGTAGAIRAALSLLPDQFWVTYGDSIGFADLDAIEQRVSASSTEAAMTVLQNEGRWDTSNVHVEEGLVTSYRSSPPPSGYRWIDFGLLLLPREPFTSLSRSESCDLALVINQLIVSKSLAAAEVTERFWEIGTPEALQATEKHFATSSEWKTFF